MPAMRSRESGWPGRRRRPAAAVVAAILMLAVLPGGFAAELATQAADSTQLVATPTADAFVKAKNPLASKGDDLVLKAEADPVAHAYLRFVIEGIPVGATLLDARLRLYSTESSSAGVAIHGGVTESDWSEEDIRFIDAPLFDPVPQATSGPIGSDQWIEIDVSGLVTGNGTINLVLTTTDTSIVSFASREADEARRPHVIVRYEDPVGPPPEDPIFIGAGDIAAEPAGRSGYDEDTAKLLDEIVAAHPGRVTVFTLGDNAYPDGSAAQFADYYDPTWGRHKAITRPVPGNHEYHTPGAGGYFDYFGTAAGDPDKGFYAYDLGAWRIYALNSMTDTWAGSEQETWLRSDLAAHGDTACVLAYWHHPRFSSGSHGSSEKTADLWRALYDHDADLILVGHDHNYQRFAPQTASGERDDERGIREFVVGTGGRSFYRITTPIANTETYATSTSGVLKLTLHAESYDFEFIPVAGETFTDAGSDVPCH